jgi:hypothetical protein
MSVYIHVAFFHNQKSVIFIKNQRQKYCIFLRKYKSKIDFTDVLCIRVPLKITVCHSDESQNLIRTGDSDFRQNDKHTCSS